MFKQNIRFVIYLFVSVVVFGSANSVRADAYVDFFRAVNVDNPGTVESLLGKGFDPNTLDERGQTPLYLAVREGSRRVFAVLLADPRTQIDLANRAGETPLMMAALKGHMDLARPLVVRGAKVRREGWTPVHYAAAGPNVVVLSYLIDRGGDVNGASPNGSTPLQLAARDGSEDSVKLLLRRGADKRARNPAGQTAADVARSAGRDHLLPLLQ